MKLEISKIKNGFSVGYEAGNGRGGQNYILDNTDEVLGRVVSLITEWFKPPIEIKPEKTL